MNGFAIKYPYHYSEKFPFTPDEEVHHIHQTQQCIITELLSRVQQDLLKRKREEKFWQKEQQQSWKGNSGCPEDVKENEMLNSNDHILTKIEPKADAEFTQRARFSVDIAFEVSKSFAEEKSEEYGSTR